VRRLNWLLSVALCWGAVAAPAQQRQITGRVRTAVTGEPVAGAAVSVLGTSTVTTTTASGEFSLAAPAGDVTVVVRRIGYKHRNVPVPAAQASIDVSLEQDVFNLEAVVVTGQATGLEKRNAPNAVATVSGEELHQVPVPSIENALQGRVAGANIQTNSGAPGGGVQVSFRGTTSIFGAADPLYVVDGVIVSDVAIPNNQQVVTASNQGSNPSALQEGQVNRIADLNPYDIQSVEILKGASASAIYGAKASNGVVIISTNRGQVGPPRFSLSQRLGFSEIAKQLGSRTFRDSTEAADAILGFGPTAAAYFRNNNTNPNFGQADFAPGHVFDQEQLLAGRKTLAGETAMNVSGGSEATRYYVSGLVSNEPGVVTSTGFKKQSLRINLDQRISSRLDLAFSSNLLHTIADRGLTNNDNAGVSYYMALEFTPSFVDLRKRPDGSWGFNPYVQSNPLQTAALMINDEDVWRNLSGMKGTLELVNSERQDLRLVGNAGVDWFGQRNTLLFPPALQFAPLNGEPGTSLLTNAQNLNTNWNLNVVHSYRPGAFTATTSAGSQEEDYDLDVARTITKNLIPGQQNVNEGTDVSVAERREQVRDFGFYGQEEVLAAQERLLLTAGVRADRSSNNGDQHKFFWYPKAAASYRLLNPVGAVDEAKLRLAWGQTGNRPSYGQRFTDYNPTAIGGLPGYTVLDTAGAPDIKPERQTEIEAGVDAVLSHGRANLELTLYQKSVSDLLLLRTVAPSTGFAARYQNAGKLRNRGIEVALGITPVSRPDLQWVFRSSFWLNRSTVLEVPDTAGFRVGGFGCSDGCFFIQPGASATQIIGNVGLRSDATCCVLGIIGDGSPDFKMSFANDVTWKGWSLRMLWDWQHGANVVNLTKLLYDLGKVTPDYATRVPATAVCPAIPTLGANTTLLGVCRLDQYGNYTGTYTESATFLKLRDLTLTYTVPPGAIAHLWAGAREVRLSASGRNLIVITNYDGMDPEVSNFGNQPVQRNIDVAPYPRSRSFWFAVTVGF